MLFQSNHHLAEFRNRPEWPVERAGKLCRVTHQSTLIPKVGVDETSFYGLDTPIHHITGSNTVSPCFRIIDRNFSQSLYGWKTIDGAIVVENAAMPVVSVLAKTDITGDVKIREERAQFLDPENYWSRGIVCGRASCILRYLYESMSREAARRD